VGVVRADCAVTLIESHQRKSVFLREATRRLDNFRILSVRAEEVQEEFDHVISRAVSYQDLIPCVKNLGISADLLTGEEVPPDGLGFVWKEPVPLPWGKQRFLRVGERRK
jgi:hypothetical protein